MRRRLSLIPAVAAAILVAACSPAPEDSPTPLLKNGGFDGGTTAPWESDEGRIITSDDGNPVLEIDLDGGVFSLAQDFAWPAGTDSLTLTMRVKANQATPSTPVQLRLRLLDAAGNSTIAASSTVEESDRWIELSWPVEKPASAVTSLMLESNRGEGTLWLDDVVLK